MASTFLPPPEEEEEEEEEPERPLLYAQGADRFAKLWAIWTRFRNQMCHRTGGGQTERDIELETEIGIGQHEKSGERHAPRRLRAALGRSLM